MRKLTLGALIVGGGMLVALPFRKPAGQDEHSEEAVPDGLDDHSLDMLVDELTENVQPPVVFQPRQEYRPRFQMSQQQPLTYDDLAVPLEKDPAYANRFNAVTGNQALSTPVEELERRFASKEPGFAANEMTNSPNVPNGETFSAPDATFASARERQGDHAVSVLDPLPPADDAGAAQDREPQWITQPD